MNTKITKWDDYGVWSSASIDCLAEVLLRNGCSDDLYQKIKFQASQWKEPQIIDWVEIKNDLKITKTKTAELQKYFRWTMAGNKTHLNFIYWKK